jgi:hypothetical protein
MDWEEISEYQRNNAILINQNARDKTRSNFCFTGEEV